MPAYNAVEFLVAIVIEMNVTFTNIFYKFMRWSQVTEAIKVVAVFIVFVIAHPMCT